MFFNELDVPFDFVERPVPMGADMRPLWRIGVPNAHTSGKCWGNRASLRQLHANELGDPRLPRSRDAFLQVINGDLPPDKCHGSF